MQYDHSRTNISQNSQISLTAHFCLLCFTFIFRHLADAFVQSDLTSEQVTINALEQLKVQCLFLPEASSACGSQELGIKPPMLQLVDSPLNLLALKNLRIVVCYNF